MLCVRRCDDRADVNPSRERKKGPQLRPFSIVAPNSSQSNRALPTVLLRRVLNVGCLLAFWAWHYLKGYFLAFFQ